MCDLKSRVTLCVNQLIMYQISKYKLLNLHFMLVTYFDLIIYFHSIILNVATTYIFHLSMNRPNFIYFTHTYVHIMHTRTHIQTQKHTPTHMHTATSSYILNVLYYNIAYIKFTTE